MHFFLCVGLVIKFTGFSCSLKTFSHGLKTFLHGAIQLCYYAAPWRKRLDARLPLLGFRFCFSVSLCGFNGGRNGVWVGFSWVSPVFSCHKFHSTISSHSPLSFRFISFHLPLWWSVCIHAISQTFNERASSHLIPRPGLVSYYGRLARWRGWRVCNVGEAKEGLKNELWRRWSNITAHSPNLPSLYLRHSSFSNPSFAPTASQALHLRHLASRPCVVHELRILYNYVTRRQVFFNKTILLCMSTFICCCALQQISWAEIS